MFHVKHRRRRDPYCFLFSKKRISNDLWHPAGEISRTRPITNESPITVTARVPMSRIRKSQFIDTLGRPSFRAFRCSLGRFTDNQDPSCPEQGGGTLGGLRRRSERPCCDKRRLAAIAAPSEFFNGRFHYLNTIRDFQNPHGPPQESTTPRPPVHQEPPVVSLRSQYEARKPTSCTEINGKIVHAQEDREILSAKPQESLTVLDSVIRRSSGQKAFIDRRVKNLAEWSGHSKLSTWITTRRSMSEPSDWVVTPSISATAS